MSNASILIVEDNNIVMLELKDRLLEMGYNVVDTASSGTEAISKAGLYHPDLIMMDIRLKGEMDGIEAVEKIHQQQDTPVVYLTAHTDDNTVERAKHTTPYGYIIKPFEERELRTTIEMSLYKYSMEKKLKESEHWLSATLKSIGDALIATDGHGIIKLINRVGEEITGWTSTDALGKNIEDVFIVVEEKTDKLIENPVMQSLKSGEIIGAENKRVISKNGVKIPIDFSSAPINYGNDITAGVVLVFRDVTEREAAKEIIEKQKIFLKTIIDTDPNYISVKNSEGRFELANKATADTFGYSTEELSGKYDYEIYDRDEISRIRETDLEVIETLKEIFIPEERLIDSKGKVHLLQTFKRAVNSQSGDEKLVLSVGSDITVLKEKEKQLVESEERLNTLLKSIPDIVLRFNKYGELLDYHMQDSGIFHADSENLIGKKINNLFETKLTEQILISAENAFATEQVQVFEYDYVHKNKNAFAEIRIVNNGTDEFNVIIKDITNFKNSQLELKELNASKDKFFSIIAHDLRSPFNSLIGLSDILVTEINDLSPEDLTTISVSISKSAKSIFNLLENLLQWSRIKTGRINFAPSEIRLKGIIEKTLSLYKNQLENKMISVSVEIASDPFVFADQNMVDTIARNIISNAIKFTNPLGKISITSNETEDHLEISISDNGIGIREDILNKLFKIEENITTKGTQNEHGSGLGLILCKEFIELNGGKLTVNSKYGEGSTFKFLLPKNK